MGIRARLLAILLGLSVIGSAFAQTATNTTLTNVTPVAPLFGQPVTLTAQVTPSSAPGTVSFMDGGVLVGVGKLNASGIAQMKTISLSAGKHFLRAVYGGNGGGFLPSQSVALPYVVTALPEVGLARTGNYGTGDSPQSIAVGDFNGDGKADLVTISFDSQNVSVLLGSGDGTFQAAIKYSLGDSPYSVAVGDFNGDGKADLVTTIYATNSVSVLLGNGDGTFQAPVNSGAGQYPSSVAVGDFNGDGKADLAVTNGNSGYSNDMSVLLGNGDGTFQAATKYDLGTSPYFVAVEDFNGDSKADLVTANPVSKNVSVLLGYGDGTFQAPVTSGVGTYPDFVAVGDLNGDGKVDLVTPGSGGVSVLLGYGDGTFQAPVTYGVGDYAGFVAVGDFNGDGKGDLVTLGYSGVSVLLGYGDGTFQAPVHYGTYFPNSLAIGDFNDDGMPDVAVGNRFQLQIFVGVPGVAVPSIVGTTKAAATAAIIGPGFVVGTVTTASSNLVPAGSVISQTPTGGSLVTPGSTVSLVVSCGAAACGSIISYTYAGTGTGVFNGTPFTNAPFAVLLMADASTRSGIGPSYSIQALSASVSIAGFPSATIINAETLLLNSTPQLYLNSASGMVFLSSGSGLGSWDLISPFGPKFFSLSGPGSNLLYHTSAGDVTFTVASGNMSASLSGSQPISVGPSKGSEGRQVFSFVARDALGTSNIQYSQFLFSKSGLNALNACYISYDPVGNVFYLLSDDMTQWYGLLGGNFGTIGNAQCSIYGSFSGASKSGADLTVSVDISFRSGFAGLKTIYQFSGDTAGNGSGWQSMGTWNDTGDPNALELVSLTPSSGSGASQVFTAVVKFGSGTRGGFAQFLMNAGLSGFNGCFITYVPSSDVFFLLNDAGTAWFGLFGGSAAQVSNGQCTLHGAGSGGTVAGSDLTITYNLDFKVGFAGTKQVFMQGADYTGIEVWRQMGTWNP